MKKKSGPKPHTDDKTFIECWNKHDGDARLVAKELGLKYNSAFQRGKRLQIKHGMEEWGIGKLFDPMYFQKMESEK